MPKNRKLAIGLAAVWLLLWCDWSAWYLIPDWLQLHAIAFTAAAIGASWWFWKHRRDESIVVRCLIATIAFIPIWQWCVFVADGLGWRTLARFFALFGLVVAFFTGLVWVIWYVERESRRRVAVAAEGGRLWDPLNLHAWFYRDGSRKLDQSLFTLGSYILIFFLLFLILTRLSGCREIYEMPAGGGEPAKKQIVQIQKIIEKKIVINPFSAVIFNPPPIENVKLQLQELTKHAYQVGYGEGKGAGFAGGTSRGKVRFIRLEYGGGDWDQGISDNADINILVEYGVRTGQQVSDEPETRLIAQLGNFPVGKSPPFVYMTGQRSIGVSQSEVETLREFMLDKHGMLFADNGGSAGWHGQFFSMMDRVLPTVKPIRVPLDHPVHSIPYQIPFLPYVAPHGGKDAWGWVVDGRLVCYYHPGDIGDAWADGHAGVKRDIWEYCYQLGTNVIFYAHLEYSKWLESNNPNAAGGKSAPPASP